MLLKVKNTAATAHARTAILHLHLHILVDSMMRKIRQTRLSWQGAAVHAEIGG
jgi:hypothetical protein